MLAHLELLLAQAGLGLQKVPELLLPPVLFSLRSSRGSFKDFKNTIKNKGV